MSNGDNDAGQRNYILNGLNNDNTTTDTNNYDNEMHSPNVQSMPNDLLNQMNGVCSPTAMSNSSHSSGIEESSQSQRDSISITTSSMRRLSMKVEINTNGDYEDCNSFEVCEITRTNSNLVDDINANDGCNGSHTDQLLGAKQTITNGTTENGAHPMYNSETLGRQKHRDEHTFSSFRSKNGLRYGTLNKLNNRKSLNLYDVIISENGASIKRIKSECDGTTKNGIIVNPFLGLYFIINLIISFFVLSKTQSISIWKSYLLLANFIRLSC